MHAIGQYVFQKTFGNSSNDIFYDIEQISNGNIFLCGKTYSSGSAGYEIYVIRCDANGEIIWSKSYGSLWDDLAYRITELQDNTLIISGATKAYGLGHYDNYILRIDLDGELIWSINFGANMSDFPYAKTVQDANGDLFILGITESYGSGGKDICLTKMNLEGKVLWSKFYGTEWGNNDWGYDFDALPGGDFLITSRGDHSISDSKACLIQVNSEGEIIWAKSYNNNNQCFIFNSDVNQNGDILSVGMIMNEVDMEYDAFILKFVDGEAIWTKSFGGIYFDYATSVSFNNDGSHLIAGYTTSYGFGQKDAFLLSHNVDGTLDWGKIYGGELDDASNGGVHFTVSETGYYIASGTFSFGNAGEKYYLIKTDLEGVSNCNETDFTPEFQDLTLLTYDPIIISGNLISPQVIPVINDVQSSEELICSDTLSAIPELLTSGLINSTIAPNPSADVISVWFGVEIESGEITITNAAGLELNKIPLNNNNNIDVDVSNIKSGMYFIVLKNFISQEIKTIKFLKN